VVNLVAASRVARASCGRAPSQWSGSLIFSG
jgi:hypothetical protein